MTDGRIGAFFDFDGTLIHGDSQEMEFCHRFMHGRINSCIHPSVIMAVATGILSFTGLISQERHNLAYISTYRGMTLADAYDAGEKIFKDNIKKKFYTSALRLIRGHRENGELIVIVSATPAHILEPVKNFLNPDAIICTELGIDRDGKFTGKPAGNICIGKEKGRRVREFAAVNNIDLSASYAYSDHHADIELLECAGKPAAVNPTARLRRIALKRGWGVIDFSSTDKE